MLPLLMFSSMFCGGACKRLNAFPKLGGLDFCLQMLLDLYGLMFFWGRKAKHLTQ